MYFEVSPVPAYVVAIPVVVALLVAVSGRHPNLRDGWSILGAVVLVGAVSSMLPGVVDGRIPQATLLEMSPGILEGSPDIRLTLRADPAGMIFALLASALWVVTGIYTVGYMRGLDEHKQTRFFAAFALSLAATMGVALAANLLTFVVFYELLTLVTYPLIIHRETEESVRAGRRYLAYTLSAGVALIGAAAWMQILGIDGTFRAGGFLDGADLGGATRWGLLALLVVGVGVKAAVMPLHSWLPAAMVAPTPVSALLHAVAVVKAGVFGMVRVLAFVFGAALLEDMGAWLLIAVLSGATMIIAAVLALRHDNLKRRLAYSTISHLSYIVLGAALLGPIALTGALLHIVGHGITKITLFFCAGAIHVRTHKENVSELEGIGWQMPLTMGAFALASLSMAGIPPFVVFVSKSYLAWGAADAGQQLFVVLYLLSGVLSAAYLFPVVVRAFRPTPVRLPYGEADLRMVVPIVVTALAALAWGIAPDIPFRFLELAGSVAQAAFPDAPPVAKDDTVHRMVQALELFTAAGIVIWVLKDRLRRHAVLTLGTDWLYGKARKPARVLVQEPLEAVFAAAERATASATALASALANRPNEAWAGVIGMTRYARRNGVDAAASLLGRPPLGVAVAAVLMTFAVIVLIAALR